MAYIITGYNGAGRPPARRKPPADRPRTFGAEFELKYYSAAAVVGISFSTSFISPFSNVMMATLFCGSL